jgi:hypothetical protein
MHISFVVLNVHVSICTGYAIEPKKGTPLCTYPRINKEGKSECRKTTN